MWKYPAAVVIGFVVQWFYLPSNSNSPKDGLIHIMLLCVGSCIAYWKGWR